MPEEIYQNLFCGFFPLQQHLLVLNHEFVNRRKLPKGAV